MPPEGLVEDPGLHPGGDPQAVVLDGDDPLGLHAPSSLAPSSLAPSSLASASILRLHAPLSLEEGDPDPRDASPVAEGVLQEVAEDLLQHRIGEDLDRLRLHLEPDLPPGYLGGGGGRRPPDRLADPLPLRRLDPHLLVVPGEGELPFDRLRHLPDPVDVPLGGRVPGDPLPQEVDVPGEGGDLVLDVVAGDAAEELQLPVRLLEGLMVPPDLGDILGDPRHPQGAARSVSSHHLAPVVDPYPPAVLSPQPVVDLVVGAPPGEVVVQGRHHALEVVGVDHLLPLPDVPHQVAL